MRCENPPGSAPTEPDKSADIAKVKRALGALKTFVGYFHVGIFFLERSKEKNTLYMYPTEVVTIRNCSPTRQNRHKSGRCFDSLFLRPCPTTGYGLFNSLSNTNCHTSLSVFNGSYPRGFRPLVFGAAVSPRTTQASSS